MGEAARNKNVARLRIIDGSSTKSKRIKTDGTVDKRCYNTSNKKKGSTKVYFLTREEIDMMKSTIQKNIDGAKTPTNELMHRRNYALFCMGINVGLRISDLIKLKWGDIFDKCWEPKDIISIKPKKTERYNKYVTIAFNDNFKSAAKEYKEQATRLKDLPTLDDYIFCGKMDASSPIKETSVGNMIKKLAEDAGIKKNICTHSLRKSFGRNFYMEAKDRAYALRMLQEAFGHESPATTLTYIGVTMEELVDFYNSVNL